jgi:hypothetical protein
MKNKGKIIAILLISIMVTALVISCEDPMAKYSNDELIGTAIIGLELAALAYEEQYDKDFDPNDLPDPSTYALTEQDAFGFPGIGINVAKQEQVVLLDGYITIRNDDTATIKARIKIKEIEELPSGTFTVLFNGSLDDIENATITVNGRKVNFND